MIKVESLTKRYARTVAVNNVSFEVPKGQIVGFLGPNGAGKTTTMRVLTCFLPPSQGTAEVAGFDVSENPMEVKKRIGYLPETPPLYPEMEVVEYLHFVGRLKGVAKADLSRRVDEVAERCRVADVKTKLISKLSKGYRQRVGLAQAIIHNPDVLILDEFTAGLDPKQIIETRQLIKELRAHHHFRARTSCLEVEQTCERVIIINKGRVVATDSGGEPHRRMRGAGVRGTRDLRRGERFADPAEARAGLGREPRGGQRRQRPTARSSKWRACKGGTSGPSWRGRWSSPAGIFTSCTRWLIAWKKSSSN
ncbi:MAG: ATP-binding cassette domain-containing protein [Bryobacteraceae bacterium]